MIVREIPKLQTLCLRSIGGKGCSAEDTFAKIKNNKETNNSSTVISATTTTTTTTTTTRRRSSSILTATVANNNNYDNNNNNNDMEVMSTASRLLRSFKSAPSSSSSAAAAAGSASNKDDNDDAVDNDNTTTTYTAVIISRSPVIGNGAGRRKQANDVDLNHPWIAVLPAAAEVDEEDDEENGEDSDKQSGNDDNDDDDDEEGEGDSFIIERSTPPPPSSHHLVSSSSSSPAASPQEELIIEYGSPSLDLLQQFVDALVELGRMDDGRLGVHFFQEWKANVLLTASAADEAAAANNGRSDTSGDMADIVSADAILAEAPPPTKRRRTGGKKSKKAVAAAKAAAKSAATSPKKTATTTTTPPLALGSLSLHNATIYHETIDAMVESGMTRHLAVLDLTGIQPLTDDMLHKIIIQGGASTTLRRLSVKNCRRLTNSICDTLQSCTQLTALDIGGTYNVQPPRVIELVCHLMALTELHASGLSWTGETIKELTSLKSSWKALSLGFLATMSNNNNNNNNHGGGGAAAASSSLKECLQLTTLSKTLQSLALPFCEHLVDAALLGVLGRHLPNVRALDLRGNGGLGSLTGWYDGRATIVPSVPPQALTVLARYSGISKSSLEDTKRIHPLATLELTCVLDSEGIGEGILRREETKKR